MDSHCFWINNCVGVNNRKFYIQFLLYSFLSSVMVALLFLDAVWNILFERNQARRAWRHEYFWIIFWMNVTSGALGAYFSYHLWQLLQEQYESIKENQSFIDDLKDQYGEPNDVWSGLKMALGEDVYFWLFPTSPIYSIDYNEKVWPKAEIVA